VNEPPRDPKAGPVLWTILGLVILLFLGLVAWGATMLLDTGSEPEASYPSAWDARIAPYVAVVEEQRGLEFEHPVHVDFLTVKDFRRQITTDEDDLTLEDRADLENDATMLRAVGLLDAGDDLFDRINELSRVGVVGYYSDEDERIRIRGKKLTPAVESVLVHELTHALQDQHFDLETRLDLLEKRDDPAALAGFRAVVEGDAKRVETAWKQDLPTKRRKALEQSLASQLRTYEQQSRGIPAAIQTAMGAPYALGEALLRLAEKRGTDHAIDELFIKPPSTDEHLIDPWTLLEEDAQALRVDPPRVRPGETKVGEGTFGASSWLLMLAERRPAWEALDAVDGWGGDAFVTFTRDDVDCVRVTYRGDRRTDLDQMQRSLRAWVAGGPQGAAGVEAKGRSLLFESCDPGKGVAPSARGAEDALQLVLTRTYVSSELTFGGAEFARCATDRVLRRFELDQLNDPALVEEMQAAMLPCRS
jgi:hypothetical protein